MARKKEREPEIIKNDKKKEEQTSLQITRFDPLSMYLAEVKKYKPLTREDEHELAIRYYKSGDVDAAYRLIMANLRLVIKIAFESHRAWANIMDLIQEGNIGLMLAMKKFDPYRGIRLPTYATWWIRAYILKFILDNWKLVRVGTTNVRRKLLYNLRKEKERLEQAGFVAEPKLLSARLHASEKDIIEVEKSLGVKDVSLDAAVGEDGRRTVIDQIPSVEKGPSEEIIDREFQTILKDKLGRFRNTLNEKETFILEKRLLSESPLTLQEIGDKFGLTREGIRLIEKKLIKKLKAYLTKELREFEDFRFVIQEKNE